MIWNRHYSQEGNHAFLSASRYHWVNYDKEKLKEVYNRFNAAQRGTELHELACNLIRLGVKLPKTTNTLNLYVNDCIGFKMSPEIMLYYSNNCFGTCDAISFRTTLGKGTLRIHDLKTGTSSSASMKQLEIYAAIFCLEYGHNPEDIYIELRMYKDNQAIIHIPEFYEIQAIMDKIVEFDEYINKISEGDL